MASSIASHPADTLLSKVNARKKDTKSSKMWVSIVEAVKELRWRGIWRGTLPRMGMVGVLAAFQLLAYDFTKVSLNLPVSQGVKERHGK